jgi:hypothetical protein
MAFAPVTQHNDDVRDWQRRGHAGGWVPAGEKRTSGFEESGIREQVRMRQLGRARKFLRWLQNSFAVARKAQNDHFLLTA